VQQSRFKDTISAKNLNVNYRTLNDKQMTIFKQIELYYNDFVTKYNQVELLKIIIIGMAETGKSYLINAIRIRFQEMAMNNGIETLPMIVIALTGVAAFNILSAMIHSTLSVLINSLNFDIQGE